MVHVTKNLQALQLESSCSVSCCLYPHDTDTTVPAVSCQNLTVEVWITYQTIPHAICGKASHSRTIHLLLHLSSSQHHQIMIKH